MNRRAPIVFAAVFVLVALAALFLLVRPKMRDVSATKDLVATAKDQGAALRAELASLKEAQANAPQVEAQIAELKAQVPPTPDLPGLIRQLTLVADASGVDFFSVSPGVPTVDASGTFSTITTGISVSGGYFQVEQYLFQLETMPRAAKVTSVSISTGGAATSGANTSLSMQISVDFYTTDTSAGPGSEPGPSTSTSG